MRRFGPPSSAPVQPSEIVTADRSFTVGAHRRRPRSAFLAAAARASSARELLDVGSLTRKLFTHQLPQAEKFRQFYGRIDMVLIQETLRAADVGIMTPQADMSRESLGLDPHALSLAQKRFGALGTLEFKVDDAKGDGLDTKLAAEIGTDVRRMLSKLRGAKQSIYDIAWGLFDGRAALEIDWQNVGGKKPYQPRSLDWIHPRRLSFGTNRELRIINTFTTGRGWWVENGVALGDYPGKFATWQPRYFCDYPEREGLGRRSLYWCLFKRFGMRMRMILTELFAVPWRTIEFDPDSEYHQTSWEDLDDAEDRAEALGGENTVAMPPGARLKVQWPGENQGQLFELTRTGVNEELSKLWVLNTATTDAKPDALGGGTANVHKGEQSIALVRDAFGIGEVVQQDLVDVYVVLNYGPQYLDHAPTVTLASKDEIDRAQEQAILDGAIAKNIPVSVAVYYERTGIPQPSQDEPVLVMAADAMGQPSARIIYPPGYEGPRFDQAQQQQLPPAGDLGGGDDGGGGEGPAGGNGGGPGAPPPAPAGGAPEGGAIPEAAALAAKIAGATPKAAADDTEAQERARVAAERRKLTLVRPLVNGAEEDLVARGVREGIRQTSVWAQTLVDSIDEDGTHLDAHTALAKAAEGLNLETFARVVERTVVLGLALGAIDSAWEIAASSTPAQKPFAAERAEGLMLASPIGQIEIPQFTTKPFGEAIAAFLRKKIVSRRVWDRLTAEAKRRAFTIAGLAKQAMLDVAHSELATGIADGIDLRAFRANLAARFESNGWTPLNKSHVETIFRTNIAGAYASGRDVQQRDPDVLAARPYWQILGVNDDRTRHTHRAVHGLVLHYSDPFWSRAPLPWGFNERCTRTTRSKADLDRLGLTVTSGSAITGLPDKGFVGGVGGASLFTRGREAAEFRALCLYEPALYADLLTAENEPAAETAAPIVQASPAAQPGMTRVYAGSLVVLIDRPAGTVETGVGADGAPWSRTWPFDSGELPRTQAGDGEPIDVFCGPVLDAPIAFWIVQKGRDPELRLALGWPDEAAVLAAYASVVPVENLDRIYPQPVEHVKAILGIAPVAALLEAIRGNGFQLFDEGKVKRDHGKFAPKGGGDSGKSDEDKAKEKKQKQIDAAKKAAATKAAKKAKAAAEAAKAAGAPAGRKNAAPAQEPKAQPAGEHPTIGQAKAAAASGQHDKAAEHYKQVASEHEKASAEATKSGDHDKAAAHAKAAEEAKAEAKKQKQIGAGKKAAATKAAKKAKGAAAAVAAAPPPPPPQMVERALTPQEYRKSADMLVAKLESGDMVTNGKDVADAVSNMNRHTDSMLRGAPKSQRAACLKFSNGHDYEMRALERGASKEELIQSRMKKTGENRDKASKHVDESVKLLPEFHAAQDRLGVDVPPPPSLFRGMSVSDRTLHDLMTKDHWDNSGMSSSTSLTHFTASSFSEAYIGSKDYRGDECRHRVVIQVTKASKSLPMTSDKLSEMSEEKEMVLRRDGQYRITDRKRVGNRILITMEER